MRILSDKWLSPTVADPLVEPSPQVATQRVVVHANPLETDRPTGQSHPAPEIAGPPAQATLISGADSLIAMAEVAIDPLPPGLPAPANWWDDDPFPAAVEEEAAQSRLPRAAAAPCGKCGSPFFWSDQMGGLHCCECVPIPSRSIASGDAWRVLWSPQGNVWEDWTPLYWNPFDHAEQQTRRRNAALPADDF